MLIDIHSHRLHTESGLKQFLALEASLLPEFRTSLPLHDEESLLSVGIHPWNASFWTEDSVSDLLDVFLDRRVLLMGEIGLDKLSSVPFDSQKSIFKAQIEIAEQIKMPVLLHIVRAMSDVLEMKRTHCAVPAWIVHGFRGGKQEAEQYIRKEFYLSFGPRFNAEGLLACPVNRLFLETDDSGEDLRLVYERVAQVLGCTFDCLERQVEINFRSVFHEKKEAAGW